MAPQADPLQSKVASLVCHFGRSAGVRGAKHGVVLKSAAPCLKIHEPVLSF